MALDVSLSGDRKAGDKLEETLRFDIDLNLPTDDTFNEFSYLQLVREKRRKEKQSSASLQSGESESSSLPGVNAFGDSHDELVSIAKRLEDKNRSGKLRRAVNDSDCIDRGYGYDLADSFVDDSEFYEDFVPDHLDTKFGGFYINTGELEFKMADDVDDDDDFAQRKPKKPKLIKQPSHHTPQAILASQKLKKAKQHVALQKAPQAAKKALFTSSLASIVKQSSLNAMKPPSPKGIQKKVVKVKTTSTSHPGDSTFSSQSFPLPSPVVPISIGDRSVTVPIFNSSPGSGGNSAGSEMPGDATRQGCVVANQSPLVSSAANEHNSVSSSPTATQAVDVPKPPPALPGNLPPLVLEHINKIVERIKLDIEQDGKITNKKREAYNERLVEMELTCRDVSIKNRHAVFEYLAYNLGVARGTLTKRMKPVFKRREDVALVEPLLKMKLAVEASMPKQIALYNEELLKARLESISSSADKSFELEEETKGDDMFDEVSLTPGGEHTSENLLSDSQTPGDQSGSGQPPGSLGEGGTSKSRRLPRKRYRWNDNDEIKKLLCDVVQVKVESEQNCSRISKEKGEEVIQQFLEEKVKPVWPKGWMQKSILYKMSEPAHKNYTSPLPRKGITIKKEKLVAVKKELCESKATPNETSSVVKNTVIETFPTVTVPKIHSPSSASKTASEAKTPSTLLTTVLSGSTKSNDNSTKRPLPDNKLTVLSKGSGPVRTGLNKKPAFSQLTQTTTPDNNVSISNRQIPPVPTTATTPKHAVKKAIPSPNKMSLPSASKIDYLLQAALTQQTKVTVGEVRTSSIPSQPPEKLSYTKTTSVTLQHFVAPSKTAPSKSKPRNITPSPANLQSYLSQSLPVTPPVTTMPTISNRLSAVISGVIVPITRVQTSSTSAEKLQHVIQSPAATHTNSVSIQSPAATHTNSVSIQSPAATHTNSVSIQSPAATHTNSVPIQLPAATHTNSVPIQSPAATHINSVLDFNCRPLQLTLDVVKSSSPEVTCSPAVVSLGNGSSSNNTQPGKHRLPSLPMSTLASHVTDSLGYPVVAAIARDDLTSLSSSGARMHSPIKSPVDQIMEEHSYLGSPFFPVSPDIGSIEALVQSITDESK